MSVTAKDVARELSLSQPTVSRILGGDRKYRASEATRARVFEAAQRLGYAPNAVASSLKRGRTDTIGLHTSYDYDVRNDFLGAIVGGLQRACTDLELDILLHSAHSDISARAMFGKLRDGRLDGVLLHAASDDPLVALLEKSGFPIVVIADPLPGRAAVTVDDAGGVELLIEHLWARGYRNFAFLEPPLVPVSVVRRRAAFETELEARGVEIGRRSVHTVDYEDPAPALDALLEQGAGQRLAVCCWNDRTAYNLLSACRERGIKVPEQLAITGFDGLVNRTFMARQLVTAHCPWDEVARVALDLLRARIDARGRREHCPTEEVCLPVHLLEGDTT